MALRIYNNLFSLNAQRSISKNQSGLGQSLARLSSGLRINRAADDAAGLAISENLRSDLTAMSQAIRNAGDGISMVNTVEGAMSQITGMLTRMRELATQAATGTLGDAERATIQVEFAALRDEIDRITSVTEFNGQLLLGGQLADGGVVGVDATNTASTLTDSTVIDAYDFSTNNATFDVRVNGADTTVTLDSDYGTAAGVASAIEGQLSGITVTNVGDAITFTNVGSSYQVEVLNVDANAATHGITADTGLPASIDNGENTASALTATDLTGATFDVSDGTTTANIALTGDYLSYAAVAAEIESQIQGTAGLENVTVTADSGTGALTFTNVGGTSAISVSNLDGGGVAAGAGIVANVGTAGTAGTNTATTLTDEAAIASYDFSSETATFEVVVGTDSAVTITLDRDYGTDANVAADIQLQMRNAGYTDFTVTESSGDLTFTNVDSADAVTIQNADANAVLHGIVNDVGTAGTVTAEEISIQVGFQATANDSINLNEALDLDGTSSTQLGIDSLSVATASGALSAIGTLQTAIGLVTTDQGKVGALQSRFVNTIANLEINYENLQAAESQIRDADYAMEISQFTRNQILVQASTAMLAQANLIPQNVLQLLG